MIAGHTHTHRPPVDPIPTVIPEPPVFQRAGHYGHRVLWVVFALMVATSGIFALLSYRIPVSRRIFHTLTTLTTIISAIAYFAMASGDASSFSCTTHWDHHKHVPDTSHDVCRQVYWARYIEWTLTSSIILFELFLIAGTSGAHTLMGISANIIMFLSGWFSAFGRLHTAQKWGWYAISVISYIFVVWHVALNGGLAARQRENTVHKLFGAGSGFALILWAVYLVVWGVATNARRTNVNTEIVIYAVLDVITKAGFGLYLLVVSRKTRETLPEPDGYWTHGFGAEGRIRITDGNGA
ncbi:hypothetical protein BGZ63DRAFT_407563 [Mariannaea sp. PMI_226]|nr:hypothetical protein BGZ63DRAFT_407563 [Mariannaea sp. PMI_226]